MADLDFSDVIEGIACIIGGMILVVTILVAVALFFSVGVFYGSGVSFVNYCRAFANNVAPERPQP